jgi:hypothetical protein
MVLPFIATLIVIFIGTSHTQLFSPQTKEQLGLEERPVKTCRELNQRERYVAGLGNRGKASTFSFRKGGYVCRRDIFETGDRSSYYQMIANTAANYSQQKVANLPMQDGWSVFTNIDDPELARHVRTIFTHALVGKFGPKKVKASFANTPKVRPYIDVSLRATDDPELIYEVRAFYKEDSIEVEKLL